MVVLFKMSYMTFTPKNNSDNANKKMYTGTCAKAEG